MTFALGWPQIIYLALWLIGIGVTVAKHGQPRSPHDAWSFIVLFPAYIALLYWGGFFGGGQ